VPPAAPSAADVAAAPTAPAPARASEAATRFVAAMPDDEPPIRPARVGASAPSDTGPVLPPRVVTVFRAADEEPASWGLLALTVGVWSGVLVLGVYATLLLVR
jgi:hypothetical protein